MWRDFPHRLAHATVSRVVVYSRHGYGHSDALRSPRSVRYMHDEELLVLPALLDALSIAKPIIVGNSDGASIALIHSCGSDRSVIGVVPIEHHVYVECICN